MATTRFLDALRGEVLTDPELLASYRHDHAAPGLLAAGMPAAVVRPTSTSEVQEAVRAAAEFGVPVVPRGAGSGLSGGANAINGCLVISLERMTAVKALDVQALTATVEPGVLNQSLRGAAAAEGLLYAPDPASMEFSTLGGNIATNAGGLCCVKYGVTRDALAEVEVVLASGRAVRLGHRTRKGVTGLDLAGLVCGSEGTLGVITEATLRLIPLPPSPLTLAASFPTLTGAGEAVARICRRHRPAMLELMDRATIAAIEAWQSMDLDLEAEAMLFARSDAGPLAGGEEIAAFVSVCEAAGASLVATTADRAEGDLLIAARRLAYSALERSGTTLLDDVCVPVPAIGALIEGVAEIARRTELQIAVFGHAGDGNMHPTIVYEPGQLDAARAAFDEILSLARALGGTVSGEHGIGLLKADAARQELGPDVLALTAGIKRAWDPQGLMNPGKGW